MPVLILVIIGLALVWYLVDHFERQRLERNDEHHEKRMDNFNRLLDTLRKNEKKNNIDKNTKSDTI